MEIKFTQFVVGIKKAIENIHEASAKLQQQRKDLLQILKIHHLAISTNIQRVGGPVQLQKSLQWVQ
jgi:hypothetical protein